MKANVRFLVYLCEEDVGYYETNYSDIPLEGKHISDIMNKIIGIYKSEEKVKNLLETNEHLRSVEIEFED